MKKVFIILSSIIISLLLILSVISRIGVLTTIAQYERDGRYVALVGVPHLGTIRYWEKIQRYLDNRECVIYEAVLDGTGLEPIMQPYKDLAQYMKLKYQGDILKYHNDWILSDITMNELLTFYSEEKIKEFADEVKTYEGIPYFILRWLFGIRMFYSYHFEQDDSLVARRNEKPVMEAIQQTKNHQWILIIYGEIHIPGMKRILIENGFTEMSSFRCNDPFRR